MRIGNNTMVERTLRDLTANKLRLAATQRDISTGKRIHRGADDPTSAARAHVLRQKLATNDTYAQNVKASTDFLKSTEEAMNQLHDVMLRLRTLAIQGSSGNLQQSDKAVLASEVDQLREVVRTIGNTKDGTGRYVFGGLKTGTEPFPGTDVTLGPNDAGLMMVEVAQGSMMTYNVTGVSVFGDTTPPNDTHIFQSIDELASLLRAGTNTTEISDISLAKIDEHLDNLNALRTDIGSRVERLDLSTTRYEDLKLSLEGMLQDTEGTDIATASLRLNQYESAFQASLAVGARALPLSLVDFLR